MFRMVGDGCWTDFARTLGYVCVCQKSEYCHQSKTSVFYRDIKSFKKNNCIKLTLSYNVRLWYIAASLLWIGGCDGTLAANSQHKV